MQSVPKAVKLLKGKYFMGSKVRLDVYVQGGAKEWSPVLMNFDPAVAYHFCLNFPE